MSTAIPQASNAPRWLQRLHYTLKPLDYMDQIAQQGMAIAKAPVIGSQDRVFFINDPQGIQQLFSRTDCITAPPNGLLQPIVGDRSIFCLEGERHRRERKLVMPPFHRDRIPQYGQLICELTHQAMATVTPGETFLARSLLQTISLDVILKVVFGLNDGPRFDQLRTLFVEFIGSFQNILVSAALLLPGLRFEWGGHSPWGRFMAVRRQISDVLLAEIGDRRQQNLDHKTDILSLLLSARDEDGQPMGDAELHDELITLLAAGHETTANAIAWALYWSHQDPSIRQKLADEIQTLGPDPDPIAISQLPYLTAVCNETLRIYPIAFLTVPREVKAPLTLMEKSLEPGDRLYGAIYLIHHRPDLYPDSRTFRPERFLERQFSSTEFLPFGGGVRRCIGDVLAQFELKLVLATLVSHYQLEWIGRTPEIPKRRGVNTAPARGVEMLLR